MSDQPPDHSSDGSSSQPESETKQPKHESESEPDPEPETFKTLHFYEDGNALIDARGTIFKVHKSILALYSEVFKDMFGLSHIKPAEDRNEPIPLDDNPKAFDAVLDAIYKGIEFIREADIVRLMDAITITHKYQMTHLEGYLQDHIIKTILPAGVADGVRDSGFCHYDEHPGLATTVLRFGADELIPWAFYSVGVRFFSQIQIGNASTYGPPPTWFAFDPDFAYSFFVLRQVINDAFDNWEKRINDFYTTSCPRSTNAKSATTKCTRQTGRFDQSSPLYISSDRKHVDPVREMAPKIKRLTKMLTDQKDVFHSGWCSKCNTTIKDVASSVLSDMHPHLVDCVARMDRMRLRDVPNI
ncbi:unnamed protein product [Rhizoctonia solani]|uniref:BTB domain-containing protein n=1 Tax=Rhizoctonia solani TaxID=456999 RepID=A0A8H3C4B0_9AGAM|nr:unnamed protein product [Rhizoctonia solani]